MTPLSNTRLRGLAEAMGWKDGDLGWLHPPEFDPQNPAHQIDRADLETWDGAGFILGEMGKRSNPTQREFARGLMLNGFAFYDVIECIVNLTPARIAQAAADALEIE